MTREILNQILEDRGLTDHQIKMILRDVDIYEAGVEEGKKVAPIQNESPDWVEAFKPGRNPSPGGWPKPWSPEKFRITCGDSVNAVEVSKSVEQMMRSLV